MNPSERVTDDVSRFADRGAPLAMLLTPLLLVAALLASCAPTARSDVLSSPEGQAMERVAQEAYHRMEIGRLRTGVYTTNVLVDLDLPRGARITVEAFDDDDYLLRLTSDAVPEVAWLVSKRGVRRSAVS